MHNLADDRSARPPPNKDRSGASEGVIIPAMPEGDFAVDSLLRRVGAEDADHEVATHSEECFFLHDLPSPQGAVRRGM